MRPLHRRVPTNPKPEGHLILMTTIERLRTLARELAGEAWDYERRCLVAQAHVRRVAAKAVLNQADSIQREDSIFEDQPVGASQARPLTGSPSGRCRALWEIRSMAAISRWLRPRPYFSRRTSRILRMDNLFWATVFLLAPGCLAKLEERLPTSGHPAPLPPARLPRADRPRVRERQRIEVDGMRRNPWSTCVGMAGRHGSESVDSMRRNEWSTCVGISTSVDRSGRSSREYAA